MFGDSWAAGAELSDDEKPFGKILAESNNLIYKDYSLGGCSNCLLYTSPSQRDQA